MNSEASTSRWSLDYKRPSNKTSKTTINSNSNSTKSSSSLTPPSSPPIDLTNLRSAKAWEVAIGPAKNVPMQAFMMYMTGGGVQIFSVMSVWFLLKGAIGGIVGVNTTFQPFQSTSSSSNTSKPTSTSNTSLLLQKSTFIFCQIALLAVGLYKVHSMGLLPTHESDWLAFKEREVVPSFESGSWGNGVGMKEGVRGLLRG